MSNVLSIINADERVGIDSNQSDIAATFFKSLVGVAPFVGTFLAETISLVIPNQKLDRLVTFAKVLDDKVKYLEKDTVKLKMQTEEFTDLLEDGLIQASRAMTDERRSYLASLLKNSITNERLSHVENKKLLALLGELNDAEVLTLKYHSLSSLERREFAELHKELFVPIRRSLGAPQANIDKWALRDSYRNKLRELGLVEPVFKRPERGKVPEFDEKTGQIKATSFRATAFGKLLLRHIDQHPTEND
ncbi:MAG: hypothetical protein QOE33_1056 [Acidobacteriota bacterium]|nr:hypothetical protein [Acidobacteriota bacterium]